MATRGSKHAYLILAHNNLPVLSQLLELVDDDRNAVFIHLDRKARDVDLSSIARACRRSPIMFVPRVPVYWGDYSQVSASLGLLRAATPGGFDYYHLVSGADLPLHSQDEIHAFFGRNQGAEFVGITPNIDERRVSQVHLLNRWVQPTNRLKRRVHRDVSRVSLGIQRRLGYDRSTHYNLTLKKGSQWCSITHELAKYLLAREPDVHGLFKYALVPDEFYVQTLVWNSSFRARLFDADDEYRGSARLIDWQRGSPYVFRSRDFDELASSDRIFARKFLAGVDMDVVYQVASHVRSRTET